MFIASKVSGGHLRYEDVLRAADGSLSKLGIDQIDLYQIHWPNSSIPFRDNASHGGVGR
ncbi:MAG: aldo/keto reductase [Chloroflexi bacterium]|nr:aldo/keto reductase [Chloroflexota bacterium]